MTDPDDDEEEEIEQDGEIPSLKLRTVQQDRDFIYRFCMMDILTALAY